MLKDIFVYGAATSEYRRRSRSNLWKVWVTEIEGIKHIEAWYPLVTISTSTYRLFEYGEKSGRMMYIEAQDELEAFSKALKMQEESNVR